MVIMLVKATLVALTPRKAIDVHIVLPSRILEAQLVGLFNALAPWTAQAHASGVIAVIRMLLLEARRVPVFPLNVLLDRTLARAPNNLLHRLPKIIKFIPGGLHGMLFENLLVAWIRVHVANIIDRFFGPAV